MQPTPGAKAATKRVVTAHILPPPPPPAMLGSGCLQARKEDTGWKRKAQKGGDLWEGNQQ